MQPQTSRDFLKAALQRLNAAEVLLRAGLTLDAQYIGGYVVECSLKSLILEKTAEQDHAEKLRHICKGASMHKPETLLGELRAFDIRLPLHIVSRMRRFDWTTSLRYETGRRNNGEIRGFLRTCLKVYQWVESLLK